VPGKESSSRRGGGSWGIWGAKGGGFFEKGGSRLNPPWASPQGGGLTPADQGPPKFTERENRHWKRGKRVAADRGGPRPDLGNTDSSRRGEPSVCDASAHCRRGPGGKGCAPAKDVHKARRKAAGSAGKQKDPHLNRTVGSNMRKTGHVAHLQINHTTKKTKQKTSPTNGSNKSPRRRGGGGTLWPGGKAITIPRGGKASSAWGKKNAPLGGHMREDVSCRI